MKLSQKLLALSGVAVADYACCPYDDYGIPSADCDLTEKTPFAGDDWRGNACKAWEGNPDASFDGNDNNCGDTDNWSSCGFQRHFPWLTAGLHGYANSGSMVASTLGTFTMGTGEDEYSIGGAPFLGGVCKLWMPVPLANVMSLNIAGVHLSGSGNHRDEATFEGYAGSVHCFSVVNPSEFLSNDGNIHNGNVAGWRDTVGEEAGGDFMQSDIFAGETETDRQQGSPHTFYSNSQAPQAAFGGTTTGFNGDSNVGPNFDVVAHFNHEFCTSHWTAEDMQMVNDWDNGVVDYPLGAGDVEEHDHTDTVDKRFANDLGAVNTDWTCVSGSGLSCDNDAGMQLTATPAEIFRWPNAGSFAGFFSFVTCANVDTVDYNMDNVYKYVFHGGPTLACPMTGTALTPADQACVTARSVVVSLGQDDFRVEDCDGSRALTARWNVRQAGTSIVNCGPGTVPDDAARCSWNWNFNSYDSTDLTGSSVNHPDAESFFGRTAPRDFAPWDSNTNAAFANRLLEEGNPTSPVGTVTIATTLIDSQTPTPAALGGTVTLDIPSKYVTSESYTGGTHTFTLSCVGPPADGSRDAFPDCYQGEEIHYEWTGVADGLSSLRPDPWATAVAATYA
jgi:hypothetical protein